MDKTKAFIWIFGILTILVCTIFYFRSNRFAVTELENNRFYKIDKWTGDTWVLYGDTQIKLEEYSESRDSIEEKRSKEITLDDAISIIKSAHSFNDFPYQDNDAVIKNALNSFKGELKVNGWKGEKINDQTYLIWYEAIQNGEKNTVGFEYNTVSSTIRRIKNAPILEDKYRNFLE